MATLSLPAAIPIDVGAAVAAEIGSASEVDIFSVTLGESGRLSVQTRGALAADFDSRTSLLGADGTLLIQSEAVSSADLDDRIEQHLLGGTYFLAVEGLQGARGPYTLTTEFAAAVPPHDPLVTNIWSDYPFALQPTFITTADFDGDGHEDIASADAFSFGLTILMGLGDGSFRQARSIPVGFLPVGISADDFDGDGQPDLITDRGGGRELVFLRGLGDGNFAEAGTLTTGGNLPFGQATADLNGDGQRDLVVNLPGSAQIGIHLGNGDGTFLDPETYGIGHAAFSAPVVADLNGDGQLDLATANQGSDEVSLLLNRGDGTFADQIRLPVGPNPVGVAVADLNDDGHADLAAANQGANYVTVYWGSGDGSFATPTNLDVELGPWGITALDFNGDGHVDLATANQVSNNVSILLNRGDGTFHKAARYRAGLQPATILARDVNGDGYADLLTSNLLSHDVSILLGRGDGTFLDDQTDVRPGSVWPQGTVGRDFNGDGHLDLATVGFINSALFVFLGRGDGTFQSRSRFEVGSTPHGVIAEDLNGDGRLDLITANCSSSNISVLIGRGDGTFEDQVVYATTRAEFVELGDFNSDGHLDLITGSPFDLGMALLPGHGDGTFGERILFDEHESPVDGIIGDFNGDGHLDVASTNFFSPRSDVSLRLGNGDGTFEDPTFLRVGERPHNIVTADFNGDGFQDLINANFGSHSVSLQLGRGDGTFLDERRFATEQNPDFLITSDLNTDGQLDLIVSNAGSQTVSILLGRAEGHFEDQVVYRVSDNPTPRRGLEAQDFNGDGRVDIAIAQLHDDDLVILPGLGDGRLGEPFYLAAGISPVDMVSGEFNNDGLLDVASVNPVTNELAVGLGLGDATFEPAEFLAAGTGPVSVLRGDFNRDGRTDLATANHGSHDVSVFYGLGTGTFRAAERHAVGKNPVAVVTSDFDLDGRLDLATANATSNDISLLLARDGGEFELQAPISAGDLPQAMVVGDFNNDGQDDLVTANYRSQDLTLLLGRGDGTFQVGIRLNLETAPLALKTADFDEDGQLDLATANLRSNDVTVMLGRGDGSFDELGRFVAGSSPMSLTIGDFNSDGRADIATANAVSDDVTFLLGHGDGTFASPLSREVGQYPRSLFADDFNEDGRLDVALARQGFREVTVLQGLGDLRFVLGDELADRVRATPLVDDFNEDGRDDVAVIGQQGKILLRLSRPGSPGTFDSPREVNPTSSPARDLALVSRPWGVSLAALDAKSPSVSFYADNLDGTFARTAGPQILGALPEHLSAGDLNGDGLTDLAIAAASNEVFVFLQDAAGEFGAAHDFRRETGISPSSVSLSDLDGDRRLDIVVTNQASGDVSVLLNDPAQPFARELRYRAGNGLYSLNDETAAAAVRSSAKVAMSASADFDGDTHADVVVTNRTTNSFAILYGNGTGGLSNPVSVANANTGSRPTAVVVDRFNADEHFDLALLNEGSQDISIFLGTGDGGFVPVSTGGSPAAARRSAGNLPTGLSSSDINGDGNRDLLVGNAFGDLLTLFGNGDGTFQPYQRAGQNIAMAVADLNHDGENDFVFANEALDRMSVHYSRPGDLFAQEREDGLLAPEAVTSADLNRDGEPDLIVANNGANNVLIYLGQGDGQFDSARSFSAGTNPTGITIDDLNGDQLLDLVVANEGSNDVNVLLGEGEGASWTLTGGPRLRAGAGPLSTSVQDATGDRIPDILVSNSRSDNVYLLPGVGGGFFDDRNPVVFDVGTDPGGIIPLGGGFATFNRGSNDLTVFTDFLGPGFRISSGGLRPVSAVAGDFNGDGISDAMVAHQGNGVVSLMLGTGSGLLQSGSFSHQDVPHPTALALGAGAEVYIAGEGQESAVLLTSFGVPVLGPTPLSLPADVFLVSGPGLNVDLNIFAETGEQEDGGPAVPWLESTIVLTALSSEDADQSGPGEEVQDSDVSEDSHAAQKRNNLMIGVDEAIRRALGQGAVRRAYPDAADLLAVTLSGNTQPDDSAELGANPFVLHVLVYTALPPVQLPIIAAAVDHVLSEWAADYAAVRDRVQLTLVEVLRLLDQGWGGQERLAEELGLSASEQQLSRAVTPATAASSTASHELRSPLFADPALLTLCAAFLGRAAATLRVESGESRTRGPRCVGD